MIDFISDVLARVREILAENPHVIFPGSTRSYVAAASDIMARITMARGGEDPVDLIVRVGVQNLYNSVKVDDDRMKKGILEEAFRRALGLGVERSGADEQRRAGVPSLFPLEGASEAYDEEYIGRILRSHASSVGYASYANLASIINSFVDPFSNIREKARVLRSLEAQLARLGLLEVDEYEGATRRVEARSSVRRSTSSEDSMRISDFSYPQNYPTLIKLLRSYRPGDPSGRVDLTRSSANMARKSLTGRPVSDEDIVVVEYSGTSALDIVLCLDVSGSMREVSGGSSKLSVAKRSLYRFIDHLYASGDRLGLVLFNFRADVLWGLHEVRKFRDYMLYLASRIFAGGGTNIASSLRVGREVLSRSRSQMKQLVLISDGRTVNSKEAIEEARRLRQQGVRIVTIGVGEDCDRNLLRDMAKVGGGMSIHIGNMSDLDRALKISRLLM